MDELLVSDKEGEVFSVDVVVVVVLVFVAKEMFWSDPVVSGIEGTCSREARPLTKKTPVIAITTSKHKSKIVNRTSMPFSRSAFLLPWPEDTFNQRDIVLFDYICAGTLLCDYSG
jgi:hypothetical protein